MLIITTTKIQKMANIPSKNREKLLKELLVGDDYSESLSKKIKADPVTVHRLLYRMEGEDLIETYRDDSPGRRGLVFFKLTSIGKDKI